MINAVTNSTVPHLTVIMGASYGAGQLRHVRPGLRPPVAVRLAQLQDRRHGPAAAGRRDVHRGPGRRAGVRAALRRGADDAAAAAIEAQIERESHAFFITGRLYDDGIIDPRDTRTVLGIALSAVHSDPGRRAAAASACSGCERRARHQQAAGRQPGRDRRRGSCAPPVTSASPPWRSTRDPDADAPFVRRGRRGGAPARRRARTRPTCASTAIVARRRRHRGRRRPPRLRLPVGERRLRPGLRRRRAGLRRARPPRPSRPWARSSAAKELMAGAGVPVLPGATVDRGRRSAPGRGRRDRVAGAGQGRVRRRRPGHADRGRA